MLWQPDFIKDIAKEKWSWNTSVKLKPQVKRPPSKEKIGQFPDCNYFNWILNLGTIHMLFKNLQWSLNDLFYPHFFTLIQKVAKVVSSPTMFNTKVKTLQAHTTKHPSPESTGNEIIIRNSPTKPSTSLVKPAWIQCNYSVLLYFLLHLRVLVSVWLCSHTVKTASGRL